MKKEINKSLSYSLLLLQVLLILIVILHFTVGLTTTCKEYIYSNDHQNCITVIQYKNGWKEFFEDKDPNKYSGIYIIPGKFRGRIPKDNYIYFNFNYGIGDNYIQWKNDTTYIVLPYTHIKENKLKDPKVVFRQDFTKEEKNEYYKNKDKFWKYVDQTYTAFSMYDLKQNWIF